MKALRRGLVILPAIALLALLVGLAIDDAAARRHYLRGVIVAVKALAALGGFYASGAFRRGDYLRRAWTSFGVSYLLLVAVDVFYPSPAFATAAPLTSIGLFARGTLVLASNAGSVLAMAMMARAFAATGLEPSGSRLTRAVVDGVFVALTLAIVGPSLYVDACSLARGELRAYGALASDAGDLVALALVAPVLRTALALRGGLLIWPWFLLTATELTWLLYDATGTLWPLLHAPPMRLAPEEVLRVLACTFAFLAGVAQRRALSAGAVDEYRPPAT